MEGKALVCVEPNAPLQVLPLELPELGPEDVEVKVLYCGVCAPDLGICGKFKMSRVIFPVIAGHEGVGEVVAAGAMATSVKVGDKGSSVIVAFLDYIVELYAYCCSLMQLVWDIFAIVASLAAYV
jgi:D-arabinose 1-dehydrogenase-like Zn-dependent alcohol dehydrogenase